MSENIKVNFMISESSKQKLEMLKKMTKLSNSAIVDKLLQFDEAAAEFFIEQFKNMNNLYSHNYSNLINGGIILNPLTMQKIIKSNVEELTEEEAIKKGIEALQIQSENNEDNQSQSIEKNEFYSEIGLMKKVIVILHQDMKDLNKKVCDENCINLKIEKILPEIADSIKKELSKDEILLEHIASLALKKLKNNI